jgi:hypothetical protein
MVDSLRAVGLALLTEVPVQLAVELVEVEVLQLAELDLLDQQQWQRLAQGAAVVAAVDMAPAAQAVQGLS